MGTFYTYPHDTLLIVSNNISPPYYNINIKRFYIYANVYDCFDPKEEIILSYAKLLIYGVYSRLNRLQKV